MATKLPALRQLSKVTSQDLFVSEALKHVRSLVQQAELLARQYDAVVANPPYMGGKGMNAVVKQFAKDHFPDAKSDLFACFIERGYTLVKDAGHTAMITMQSWMFLSSYQKMRERILREKTIGTMAHLGARAFASISGEVVQTTAFVLKNSLVGRYKPAFFRLLDGDEAEKRTALASGERRFDATAQNEFRKIPGSPLAYWVSERVREVFEEGTPLGTLFDARVGLQTGDNDQFLRRWYEVDHGTCAYASASRNAAAQSGKKWFPYNKGGVFRRWCGNMDYLVNWEDDGRAIRAFGTENGGRARSVLRNTEFYFQESLSWSKVTSGGFSLRFFPSGFIFDVAGCSIFGDELKLVLGCMNSAIMTQVVNSISPTLNFEVGQVNGFPLILPYTHKKRLLDSVGWLVEAAARDWNEFETSWDFERLAVLKTQSENLESSYTAWVTQNRNTIAEMKRLEEENNRLFIDAYGLADELIPDVPIEQITLTVSPAYRYGGTLTDEEQWTRFREDTMAELISYAVGCMMGRYSLDAPGLIYAHSGNAEFDPNRYATFPADEDGIVPLTGYRVVRR